MPILCASALYCVRVVVFKTFLLYQPPPPLLLPLPLTVGVLNPAPKKKIKERKKLVKFGSRGQVFYCCCCCSAGFFFIHTAPYPPFLCLQWPAVLFYVQRVGIYYLDFMRVEAACIWLGGPKDFCQYLMFDQDALVDVVNVEKET